VLRLEWGRIKGPAEAIQPVYPRGGFDFLEGHAQALLAEAYAVDGTPDPWTSSRAQPHIARNG